MDVVTSAPDVKAGLWLREMPARSGLVPSLNGLRALSIAIVVLSHSVSPTLFPGGFGVRVFFVLSGFLITRLLYLEREKRGAVSIPRFYGRRFLRLYPVILAYTVVVVAFCALFFPERLNVIEPLSALFYFANVHYSHLSVVNETGGVLPFAIFWSLSLEEHFYLIFPFAFVLLRSHPPRIVALSLLIIAGCLLLRIAVSSLHPELLDTYVFYYDTQYQMDSISCGVLLAALCQSARGRAMLLKLDRPWVLTLAAGLIVAGFAIRNVHFRETLRYTMMNLGIAVLIFAIVFTGRLALVQSFLNTPAMDLIGRMSYSIYVWHFGVVYVLTQSSDAGWALLPPVLTLTAALSSASYFLLERPLSSLRHRIGSVASTVP